MVCEQLLLSITKQSRKDILPFSSISLVNSVNVSVLFAEMFVEFVNLIFVHYRDGIVKVA